MCQYTHHGIDNGLGLRIDFNIDEVAFFAAAKQGTLQSLRNQVYAKFAVADLAYGQAATVQTANLWSGCRLEVFRQLKPNGTVELAGVDTGNSGNRHHMAAHHMAADFVAKPRRAFQIDTVADF